MAKTSAGPVMSRICASSKATTTTRRTLPMRGSSSSPRYGRNDKLVTISAKQPLEVAAEELGVGGLGQTVADVSLVVGDRIGDPLRVRPVAAEHERVVAEMADELVRPLVGERGDAHVPEEVLART